MAARTAARARPIGNLDRVSLTPQFDDAHAAGEGRRAARQGLGVALATSAYGISFGALSVAAGLDVWQTCALSLLMFTGGSQFAFVGVIGAGGLAAAPAAIASAALLGVRNAAYGMRMSPVIGPGFWKRVAAAQFTIDESTAVSLAQRTRHARLVGFWVTGLGDLCRLGPVDPRGRAARRRARGPEGVWTGCRGRRRIPRTALAAPAPTAGDRGGRRGRRGGDDAHAGAHARPPGADRRRRRGRRRLVQLAGARTSRPTSRRTCAEREGLP